MNQAEPEDVGRAADSARPSATFEAIVAEWIAEGTVPSWPDSAPPTPASIIDGSTAGTEVPIIGSDVGRRPAPPTPAEDPGSDDHYVPPDPPPMPRIGVTAAIGLALLGLGIVLLAMPSVLGGQAEFGLPLGLVSLALGLGWLVLRSWPSARDDDPDDGAVL